MANICTFEMRIRGTKENCYKMANSGIHCYEAGIADEKGTEKDYMLYIEGECRWSVTASMIDVDEDDDLAEKAKKFDIELEVFGYDEGEEMVEHFHYKGTECLKSYSLLPCFPEWQLAEIDLSEEDFSKYEHVEEMYVLKREFVEQVKWDEDTEKIIFNFDMSFQDLKHE